MSASKAQRQPNILVIDDDEDDLFLLTRALRRTGITNPVDCATNGEQAIKYFQDRLTKPNPAPHLPSLVLLDLKMPLVSGHAVLAWIRSQPALTGLPVYILSSSQLQCDISQAKQAGAVDFWHKPSALTDYYDVAARVKNLLAPSASVSQMPA